VQTSHARWLLPAGVALACLAACAGPAPALSDGKQAAEHRVLAPAVRTAVEYTALQVIETTPGPFANRIYVSAGRERQDASLGGGVVTTIIRHDKGVAWLLIPAKQTYEEIALVDAAQASVQARFAGLQAREIRRERAGGLPVTWLAFFDDSGQQLADAWFTDDGIAVKADFFADPRSGKPRAVISLQQLQVGPVDPALFELPDGYTRAP